MKIKPIVKRIMRSKPDKKKVVVAEPPKEIISKKVAAVAPKNKKEKNETDMTVEQIEKASNLVQNVNASKEVKVVKKDRGLIERTESSKIVLTEDNRQVLND